MTTSLDLFEAIEGHDTPAVLAALTQGADPNSVQDDDPRFTALMAAVNELEDGGPLEVVKALLQAGAAVDDPGPERDATPLLMALFRDQPQAVQVFLDAGADPNFRGGEGDSPLRWAVAHDDRDLAEKLLEHGAARTINDWGEPDGCTPLGLAAERLDLPMIALLVRSGADLHQRDDSDLTARERALASTSPDQERIALAVEMLSDVPPSREVILEGSLIESEDDFHGLISKLLDFPGYYGRNIHALWDVMTSDVERPVTLIWKDSARAKVALGPRFDQIVQLLQEVKARDQRFTSRARFDYRLA